MTTIFARITSTEFVTSLLVAFLVLSVGKCFSQNPPAGAFHNYTLDVFMQPEKANYSLRLEVETDASIDLSIYDSDGEQLAVLMEKIELHSGVYFFDLKKWVHPGETYFLKNGCDKVLQFEVPGNKFPKPPPDVRQLR
jgi:hypothetical protein